MGPDKKYVRLWGPCAVSVFIFRCCNKLLQTQYLKQYTLNYLTHLSIKLDWFVCSRSHKAKTRVSVWEAYREAWKDSEFRCPDSLRSLAEFSSVHPSTEVPVSLRLSSRRCSQLRKAPAPPWPMSPAQPVCPSTSFCLQTFRGCFGPTQVIQHHLPILRFKVR